MTDKEAVKVTNFLALARRAQEKGKLYGIYGYVYFYDEEWLCPGSLDEWIKTIKERHRNIRRISNLNFSCITKSDYPFFYYKGNKHLDSISKLIDNM